MTTAEALTPRVCIEKAAAVLEANEPGAVDRSEAWRKLGETLHAIDLSTPAGVTGTAAGVRK